MKIWFRRIGLALLGLAGLLVAIVLAVVLIGRSRFNETYDVIADPPDVSTDPAAIARGEHLVNSIAHCGYCHGPDFSGSYIINNPGSEGVVVAPNLTSGTGGIGAEYRVEDWTLAIRHGVNHEGRSVLVMPSMFFNTLSRDDLGAIIAYMQTIPPVNNILPETEPGPLLHALIGAGPLAAEMSARVIDHAAAYETAPAEGETAEYGAYLVTLGQCRACHGEELAGGQVNRSAPFGPNLTPGGELAGWTEADFITVLRTGLHPSGESIDPFMPWEYFRNLTDVEIGALWAFLQAQPARETAQP